MTDRDLDTTHPGYWPSPWPVECGGNRRQKHARGRLDAHASTPQVSSVRNGRWNVMVIRRDPGEWFLSGTMAAFHGDPPFGWVQRIDPKTLEVLAETPPLPCGDHVWCGAIAAHANGSLYNVNGSYLHRISPDCEILAEKRLPVDQAHNGLLILSDGSIVTKDLRLAGDKRSTMTRLDPESLELLHEPVTLPEVSMGRIAADLTEEGEAIYVPGVDRLFRLWVEPDGLRLDETWQPAYRTDDTHGMAWDSCLSNDHGWIMNCGDITGVRAIFGKHPNGRFAVAPGKQLSWQHAAPWSGPQQLLRVNLDSGEVATAHPFETPGGGIIAPPVHIPDHGLIVCWDSINGGMAGLDDLTLETLWTNDVRATMQPVVFAESGEIVINDFTGTDDVVVIDAPTGEVTARVNVGSPVANGMFLTAGDDRDIFYCSTLTVAHIAF